MKVEVIKHFESDDEDFGGDYYDVEIFVDGKEAATFGDYYHDKGVEKVEGFIKALTYLNLITEKDVTYKSVADR